MACPKYSTEMAERKKGQHLRMEERGAIKALEKQGLGVRAIARAIGCAPTTVTNELRRGTPARKSTRGRTPSYSPRQGEAVYAANRANCHRPTQTEKCSNFIEWVGTQIREHKWSLDACCGDAKLHDLFEATEMVCTRTLYNMVWRGDVSIKPTELPEALKRKATKHREMANKRHYGASISTRPEIACLRLEEGHWEGDTVVGKRAGQESVVFSLLEKKTETYLAFRIPGKTSEAVMGLMTAMNTAKTSPVSLRPLQSTMAASLPTSLKWNNGEPKLSLLIPTHLGSARKTNGTTACSALLFRREPPLRLSPTKIFFPPLTN